MSQVNDKRNLLDLHKPEALFLIHVTGSFEGEAVNLISVEGPLPTLSPYIRPSAKKMSCMDATWHLITKIRPACCEQGNPSQLGGAV